jgi:hypothetical protein
MRFFLAAFVALLFLVDPALAQFKTAEAPPVIANTTIDLAPLANAVIQLATTALTVIAVPLLWDWWRKKSAELKLEHLKIEEHLRETLDKGAVAAIGAARTALEVQPGGLTIDLKNQIAANAANILARNFEQTLNKLGSKDNLEKAKEVVESRIGLTEANAAGEPIIGVTTPAAAVQAAASDKKVT